MAKIKIDKSKLVEIKRLGLRHNGEIIALGHITLFFKLNEDTTRIQLTDGTATDVKKTMAEVTKILENLGWEFEDL